VVEEMAEKEGLKKIGIHTTEDNLPARGLYLSSGYDVTEIGPCTTADGEERVGYTFEKVLFS
jgi:ribosomal protein S18 acetylase RimI-like enzyme